MRDRAHYIAHADDDNEYDCVESFRMISIQTKERKLLFFFAAAAEISIALAIEAAAAHISLSSTTAHKCQHIYGIDPGRKHV